jgi:uncharacterized protein (TIRG00374 family)
VLEPPSKLNPSYPLLRYIEIGGALAVAVLLAGFVWAHTDAPRLLAAFSKIAWSQYFAAIAATFVYQIFLALRTRVLIDPGIGFFKLFLTICVQCVITTYFPAGLGELSTIYLLRRWHDIGLHLGAAAVVLSRIADLTVFLLLFAIVVGLMARTIPLDVYFAMLSVAAVLLISLAGIFVLRHLGDRYFVKWTQRSGTIGWLARHSIIFGDALARLRSPRDVARVLIPSALMWVFHYLLWFFLLQAIGLALTPLEVLWVYVLFFPISFLPLRGVAAMGPRIATWFFALQFVGIDETRAATSAFAVDILLQSLALPIGLLPLIVWANRRLRAEYP